MFAANFSIYPDLVFCLNHRYVVAMLFFSNVWTLCWGKNQQKEGRNACVKNKQIQKNNKKRTILGSKLCFLSDTINLFLFQVDEIDFQIREHRILAQGCKDD